MLSITESDKQALIDATASGASTVEYSDKKVSYRPLDEMIQTLRIFGVDIADLKKKKINSVKRTCFTSGF